VAFDPAAPYAEANGLVANPKFDLTSELIQQLMGRFALTANAQVLRTDARITAASQRPHWAALPHALSAVSTSFTQ
jgi:flagellar basal body rod protein FlgC